MFCLISIFVILTLVFLTWLKSLRCRGFIEDFQKKRVFITGADTGFGKKLALELDSRGVWVYASCYTDSGARELGNESSSRMKTLKMDVSNRESIIQAKEFVEIDLPPNEGLWALVNNAGISKGVVFEFALMEDYRDVLNVNFFGTVEMCEIFSPLIKKSRGRIVNVISILGRCSLMAGPYCCSKFAMEAYSDGLRRAMRPFGVKVAIIEPGFFKTGICGESNVAKDIDAQWEKLPTDLKVQYGEKYYEEVKKHVIHAATHPKLGQFNKLELVIDGIISAIGSKSPKSRYVIGLDAHLIYKQFSYFPDCVLDFLVRASRSKVTKTIANI